MHAVSTTLSLTKKAGGGGAFNREKIQGTKLKGNNKSF